MEDVPQEVAERNRSSRERLRAIGSALSDAELDRTIDAPWTAAALFAHIAFWDRFVLERWRLAAEKGDRTPMPEDDAVMDRINDASLRQWLAIPARAAVEELLAAASELDDLISGLDAAIVSELVTEGRERLVDRSLHRGDHLRTIEEAFPLA
jgi:DinB superfamily